MTTYDTTTSTERARHVHQANANQVIEGFSPDEADKVIQAKYIVGTASLADMLQHAKDFVTEARKRHPL